MRSFNLISVNTVVIITILLLSFSSQSFSQNLHINSSLGAQGINNTQEWVDRSDELPGMMSTGTVILIGVGVAAAVVAIILIANRGSDNNNDEGTEEESDTEKEPSDQEDEGELNPLIQYNLKNKHSECKEDQIPLNIYLSVKQNNLQISDNTFGIGLAFKF